MTKDTALRLALRALESTGENNGYHGVTQYFDETMVDQAITAIKAALEAKDEPVAWMDASRFEELRNGFTVMTTLTKKKAFFDDIAIYTTPPQRTWVGLTDEDRLEFAKAQHGWEDLLVVAEAKLKEKNT